MTNKRVAVHFLQAMGAGDVASAAACLAEGATTEAKNFSVFAGLNSREHILNMIGAFRTLMPEGLHFDIKSVIEDEELVAIECEGEAVTSSGELYRNHYCFVIRMNDGLVAEIHEYFCSKQAEEVLWPLIQASTGSSAGPLRREIEE